MKISVPINKVLLEQSHAYSWVPTTLLEFSCDSVYDLLKLNHLLSGPLQRKLVDTWLDNRISTLTQCLLRDSVVLCSSYVVNHPDNCMG
jgi:hypothetical protein